MKREKWYQHYDTPLTRLPSYNLGNCTMILSTKIGPMDPSKKKDWCPMDEMTQMNFINA